MALYFVLLYRANHKKAAKASAQLFVGMIRVRSLGGSHALSLVARAAECVTDCTSKAQNFVGVLPEMENAAGPHVMMLYYKYRPEFRDLHKSWVDAVHSLASEFPDVGDAWRVWVAAYSDMAKLPPEASQEDAERILGELRSAKKRVIRSLSEIVLLVCVLES
ncbi:hypothetical protein AB0937_18180 [Streptomyces sp. NPDC047880]|uniref:hypothetical protein n=1 Tax=Streptomyces sp. NPDC047880 TaxID=3155626 RepID=UPI003452CFE8